MSDAIYTLRLEGDVVLWMQREDKIAEVLLAEGANPDDYEVTTYMEDFHRYETDGGHWLEGYALANLYNEEHRDLIDRFNDRAMGEVSFLSAQEGDEEDTIEIMDGYQEMGILYPSLVRGSSPPQAVWTFAELYRDEVNALVDRTIFSSGDLEEIVEGVLSHFRQLPLQEG